MKSIDCIVVTYNRKDCLRSCIAAICRQKHKVESVYIVDNASTDGTLEMVRNIGFYETDYLGIKFHYIHLSENTGGAGGFYIGLKTAYELGNSDAFWVMDDDGIPEQNCLSNLVPYLDSYDYVAPVVLTDDGLNKCSFVEGHIDYCEFIKRQDESGIIRDYASPFNGVIFSRKLISDVGYPKKEMFIWGDELEFHKRATKFGYIPITIPSAIHYHPINRQQYIEIRPNLFYAITDVDWKLYCLVRNKTYISTRYSSRSFFREVVASFHVALRYVRYFHWEKGKSFLLLDAVISGIIGNFNHLDKYRK